jgi:uncharacterized protein YjbJ (UPF0337 family)
VEPSTRKNALFVIERVFSSIGAACRRVCRLVGALTARLISGSHRDSTFGANSNREGLMPDKNIDQAKGRVKEAAGALTGDQGLKNEGRVDQAKGSLKKAIDKVSEAVKGHKQSDERR